MKPHFLLFIMFPSVFFQARSQSGTDEQKQVSRQKMIWVYYNSNIEFSPKWFLASEFSERTFIDPSEQSQLVIRTHLHYNIGQNWDAAFGFAYSLQSTRQSSGSYLNVPEFRPHQEFNNKQKIKDLTISHRYKIEERFTRNNSNGELKEGYSFNFRFRYRLGVDYSFLKGKNGKQLLKARVNDEILVNAGRNIVNNIFDQNRLYAGINYQPFADCSFEIGYMNLFQQRKSGDQFYNRHNIIFSVNHKITLKHKSK